MGYTADIKRELLSIPVKHACCRQMFVSGLLFGSEPTPYGELCVRFTDPDILDQTVLLLPAPYKKSFRTALKTVGKNVFSELILPSREASDRHQFLLDHPEEAITFTCSNCQSSFIRGVFVSCGSVTAPQQDSHLECRMDEVFADVFKEKLQEAGLSPGLIQRGRKTGVYLKNNAQIQDMLGLMGASRAEFEYINEKILRSLVKEDHQITNYEIGNMARAVEAAHREIKAIEHLKALGRFSSLPDPIRYSANLRLEHPELSLKALAQLHTPPISSSGLSHRMRVIMQMAEN